MKTLKSLWLCAGISIMLASCGKESDTEKPKVELLRVEPKGESSSFVNGDTLNVSARLSDDVQLKSAYLYVEDTEGSSNQLFEETYQISSDSYSISESFVIPPTVKSGNYTITIRLVDESGKYGSFSLSTPFEIENIGTPEINLDIPNRVEVGDTIFFKGQIKDNIDLATVEVNIRNPKGYSGNQSYFRKSELLKGGSDTLFIPEQEGWFVYFPNNAKRGSYLMTISAFDSHSNISKRSIPIVY